MNSAANHAELSQCFEQIFDLCRLKSEETVLIFTDIDFPYPDYPAIALKTARKFGADSYILMAGEGQNLQDRTIHAAWTNADLILGMSFLPGDYSWMYTDLHNSALNSGARVLMVQEPPDVLIRLMPTKEAIQRAVQGADLLHNAQTIRVFSPDGTDLVMRKTGRKGGYQRGFVAEPGQWDHWPSAMVHCAPLEDSASGTLVVKPGDALIGMGLWEHAASEIRFTFENGAITNIEGEEDAGKISERLQQAGDEDSFRLAHVGWGIDPRAAWEHVGMDSESFYGNVTVALGRNIFNTPHEHCGLGGENRAKIHFDMCLLGKNLSLDNQLIIEVGEFTLPSLRKYRS